MSPGGFASVALEVGLVDAAASCDGPFELAAAAGDGPLVLAAGADVPPHAARMAVAAIAPAQVRVLRAVMMPPALGEQQR